MLQFVIGKPFRTSFHCWYDASHSILTDDPDLKREQCVNQSWLLIRIHLYVQNNINSTYKSASKLYEHTVWRKKVAQITVPLCVLDLDSENILTLVSTARTTIRSNIYLGTDNNNKRIKSLIHKHVESLVMFSPTGYSKKKKKKKKVVYTP